MAAFGGAARKHSKAACEIILVVEMPRSKRTEDKMLIFVFAVHCPTGCGCEEAEPKEERCGEKKR